MRPNEVDGYLERLSGHARIKRAEEIAANAKRRGLIESEFEKIDELKKSGATKEEIARTTAEVLLDKLSGEHGIFNPSFEVVVETGEREEFGEYSLTARLSEDGLASTSPSPERSRNFFLVVGLVPNFSFNKKIDEFFKDDSEQQLLKNAAFAHGGGLSEDVRAFVSVQEYKATDTEVSDEFADWAYRMLIAESERVDDLLESLSSRG